MRKRNRIMIIAGSLILAIVLAFMILDGTLAAKRYTSVWSEKYIENLDGDQQRIIALAIRASSSHNSQPWLVKQTDENTIELYADMEKALSVVDGDNKQLLMSQGTFIESLKQYALKYGYRVDIKYNTPDFSAIMPLIATIELKKEDSIKTLDVISSSTYAAVNRADIEAVLKQCTDENIGFSYSILESDDEVEKLEEVLLEATVIESKDEAAVKELLDVFRWTKRDKNEYRYGLSLSTMPGILKPFIQPIMKWSSTDWEAFGDSSIKQFESRLGQQTKYILIKCDESGSMEYIYAGQIYQSLILNVGEYDLRPAMQVLENFDAMKKLSEQFQQTYGQDNEVVMIIGVQEKADTSANPRHLVEDIIVK